MRTGPGLHRRLGADVAMIDGAVVDVPGGKAAQPVSAHVPTRLPTSPPLHGVTLARQWLDASSTRLFAADGHCSSGQGWPLLTSPPPPSQAPSSFARFHLSGNRKGLA
jgi:hypothetical protein